MELDMDYDPSDAPLTRTKSRPAWPRSQRGRPNGYFRGGRQPQSSRSRKPHQDHDYPKKSSIGSWKQEADNGEYPTRYRTKYSMVWKRSSSDEFQRSPSPCLRSSHAGERPRRLSRGDAKEAMVDYDVINQPLAQTKFSHRKRHHPSSNDYQQGRRNSRQKHNNYARDQENYRSTRDMHHEYKHDDEWRPQSRDQAKDLQHEWHGSGTSQNVQCRLSSVGDGLKPVSDCLKLQTEGTTSKLQKCSNSRGTHPLENLGSMRKLSSNLLKENEKAKPQNKDADGANESLNHASCRMGDMNAKCPLKEGGSTCYVTLAKDHKTICRMRCRNPPFELCSRWNLVDIIKKTLVTNLADLPQFSLFPAFQDTHQRSEWPKFLGYLYTNNKVAVAEFGQLKIHIFPPEDTKPSNGLSFDHAVVAYEVQEAHDATHDVGHATSGVQGAEIKATASAEKGTCSSITKSPEAINRYRQFTAKEGNSTDKNFVCTDPSYLKTLGQAHSGWIFGAIAELVDNSRDARASRLEISVETIYYKAAGCEIPMLSVVDDGDGMNHQEILRMVSFGHKQPDEGNTDRIGRFGVGFKTGTMRLGKDALVLTQTTESRSIAFLSQSLNEGKDNVEIPIVTYRRQAQCMEFDTSVQSAALAKNNLKAIKEFSPFNEYLIGEKAALFRNKTGTQIYMWNLDKWGSDYSLEWLAGMPGSSSFHNGDIYIRSRRVRSRPGQTSRKVYLDYSLRCYLEVIFLKPRMKIYVQGSLVRSHPLAKTLNNTAVKNDEIMGKPVQLILGRSQLEWDEANCGVFLYWHGRLIEAYKRVGGMIHSADMGRGVIGIIDVTELMDDENGGVWVHCNKQGFQDCEAYALLEEWLGNQVDEYWDKHFDPLVLKRGNARYKPDHEWVQCEKCRKWRILDKGFDSSILTGEWFCYMKPFCGQCEVPEHKPEGGVVTVATKRVGFSSETANCEESVLIDNDASLEKGKSEDDQTGENDVERPVLKRLRRGPARISAKK